MSLKNSQVVVVGGSEGIGLSVARAAAEAGAAVTIAGRTQAKLDAAREALGRDGLKAAVGAMDADSEDSAAAFFAGCGEIDHLVLLVGGKVAPMPFVDTPMAAIGQALHGKFWAQWIAAKHGAPRIREGGSLILTSGAASRRFSAGLVWLSAMNAGIEAMGRGLAVELAPRRIRVNVVCPGMVKTAVWDAIPDAARTAMFDQAAGRLPAGFVAGPDDIAGAYLHLMASRYTTGSVLDIDGGAQVGR